MWIFCFLLFRRPPEFSEQPLHPGCTQQYSSVLFPQQPPTGISSRRRCPSPLTPTLFPQQPFPLHYKPQRPLSASAASRQPSHALAWPRSTSRLQQTALEHQPPEPISCLTGKSRTDELHRGKGDLLLPWAILNEASHSSLCLRCFPPYCSQ